MGSSIAGKNIDVTKNGTGTLEYTGNNTYQGETVVNGGTLLLNNANGEALSTSSGKSDGIVVNNGGTLRLAQNNQIGNSDMNVDLDGGSLDTEGHAIPSTR